MMKSKLPNELEVSLSGARVLLVTERSRYRCHATARQFVSLSFLLCLVTLGKFYGYLFVALIVGVSSVIWY